MSAAPTVTVGLPVYNGERFLRESLDALLAQTWTDFELIISDNGSTDATAEICQEYVARDPRIRYVRQRENIGAARNHNVLPRLARGRYFKWASHDDLYAPDLVERCVAVLESHPEAVLAHCGDAFVDEHGVRTGEVRYRLDTENPSAPARLRSLLREPGGNDFYGLIRIDVLLRALPHGTYYNADRTFMAGLVMQGQFRHIQAVLYWRRQHAGRATLAGGLRERAVVLGPERADRWRHPLVRMHVEYVLGFVRAVVTAPVTAADRARALLEVAGWLFSRLATRRNHRPVEASPPVGAER
ncbi:MULTISPECIES: glycosyltransferase family 2 protein [Nocardioides]|uniref:Glycosyltransferase family 2 protein n=1 Tax=Nocardioides vastitatis TaxID=2568655 RepID=A0ABW0ZI12_9ACTN|nr:glycosyltransferase [Nocardioides sp.]THJ11208.1 glycosyltransferase [Nocardioides sp.]